MEINISGGTIAILIMAVLMTFAYFINDIYYLLYCGFALIVVVLLIIAVSISKMIDKLIAVAKEN